MTAGAMRGARNPTLLVLIAEGFLSRLGFGLISFALPLYARHLGMSLAQIGVLISLNLMAALALKAVMGHLADRYGLRRSLLAAVGARSAVPLLLVVAATPWHLYAVRVVHGMTKSLRDPTVSALIAEHGGKKSMASAFAWYQTAKSLASSIGKATAGILLTLTVSNFSVVFVVAFLASVAPVALLARYLGTGSRGSEPSGVEPPSMPALAEEAAPSTRAPQTRPGIFPFAMLGFLMNGAAQMLHGLLPVLATEYAGLSEAQTGVIYLASTLVILFSGVAFGWLSDNVSHRLALMVRGAANILSSAAYLGAPSFTGFAVGKVVDDMGKGAFRPAWGALMAHVSSFDPRRRARTIALLGMGEDAGAMAGPIVAGLLWSAWGVGPLLVARMLVAVLAELHAARVTRGLMVGDHTGSESVRVPMDEVATT